jgi:tetratricopeptide (TPR) repeat protein
MRASNVYRNATSNRLIISAICAVMMLGGCGSSDGGVDPNPLPTLVEQGWDAFETGDFADAKSNFEQAIADNPTDNAAHNGLGWANMRLDDLQGAVTSFDAALTHGFAGADPHAGKAIVLRDLEPVDYDAAIASANTALGIESSYAFTHDAGLDWKDLRLILAQSHFMLGEYIEANAQVGVLGGTMQNSASPTFVEDLLAEIERLGQILSG